MNRSSMMVAILFCAMSARAQNPTPQQADGGVAVAGAKTSIVTSETPSHVRVSSGVMATLIATRVEPVYPARAREQGVSGTVILRATISREGAVEDVSALSGPKELQRAAVEAVRQWRYRPYLLNGEPAGVETLIQVPFGDHPAPEAPLVITQTPPPAPVAQKTSGGQIIKRVQPEYPADAKRNSITGAVIIKAIISKDGHVKTATAESGPQPLRQAAVDAFRQWTFAPFTVDGKPVEVHVTNEIDFSLKATVPNAGQGPIQRFY